MLVSSVVWKCSAGIGPIAWPATQGGDTGRRCGSRKRTSTEADSAECCFGADGSAVQIDCDSHPLLLSGAESLRCALDFSIPSLLPLRAFQEIVESPAGERP